VTACNVVKFFGTLANSAIGR